MLARRLREHLDEAQVRYTTIGHSIAYTAQEIAASAHVSGHELAKVVIVELDGELVMAVVRGTDKIDLDLLRAAAGASRARLASEGEFESRFPGVDPGAMPPFGNLYGMPVYVDEALGEDDEIAFNAGTHYELVRLAYAEFERLVQPKVARFAA